MQKDRFFESVSTVAYDTEIANKKARFKPVLKLCIRKTRSFHHEFVLRRFVASCIFTMDSGKIDNKTPKQINLTIIVVSRKWVHEHKRALNEQGRWCATWTVDDIGTNGCELLEKV
jgi:hypothetical protein